MIDLVVEVRGGVVVGVYTPGKKRVVIVDWDAINEGRASPVISRTNLQSAMPSDTRGVIENSKLA